MQLNIGDRVHFVVGQNEKSCVAQQIDVQGKTQFVQQVTFRFWMLTAVFKQKSIKFIHVQLKKFWSFSRGGGAS